MKKFYVIALVAVLVFAIFAGCSINRECPEKGIWYCDTLNVYIDMATSTGAYLDQDGNYKPLFIQIDYGTGFFINYCESQESENYLNDDYRLATDYSYRNGVLHLKDRNSGESYRFIQVAEEDYPVLRRNYGKYL